MKNIIVLKQNKTGSKSYNFADEVLRYKLIAALSLAVVTILLLGIGTGYLFFNSKVPENFDMKGFQHLVKERENDIQLFKSDVNRDLDALALQIGGLYAQSMRINALGERLTEVTQLSNDEFDFSIDPGVGGSELDLTHEENTPEYLFNSLFSIKANFLQQEQQLNLLNTLLTEQNLDQQIKPSGKPIRNGWISSNFGGRPDPFTGKQAFHSGIDFGGKHGAIIQSVADGVIIWSGERGGYGKLVEIDHGAGFVTRYAHLSKTSVSVGEKIIRSQEIGVMGKTGRSTSEHLHFEVLKNGKKINPWPFLTKK